MSKMKILKYYKRTYEIYIITLYRGAKIIIIIINKWALENGVIYR